MQFTLPGERKKKLLHNTQKNFESYDANMNVFYGENNSGKTSLFNRFRKNTFDPKQLNTKFFILNTEETIFVSASGIIVKNNIPYELYKEEIINEIYCEKFMNWKTLSEMNLWNREARDQYASFIDSKFNLESAGFSKFSVHPDNLDHLIKKIRNDASISFDDLKNLLLGIVLNKSNINISKHIINIFINASKWVKAKLSECKNKEAFLTALYDCYAYAWMQCIYRLYTKSKIPSRKTGWNKNKRRKIESAMNNDFAFNGKSRGMTRLKKIRSIIFNQIVKYEVREFVLDDPFDNLSYSSKFKLCKMFTKLSMMGVQFMIFTNDREAYNMLMNMKNGFKLNAFIIFQVASFSYVCDVTNINNIIFKYNNNKYYYDLVNFFKNEVVSDTIQNLIIASHRDILNDAALLLGMCSIEEVKKIVHPLKKYYDFFTKILKEHRFVASATGNKSSNLALLMWNYKESELNAIFKNSFSSLKYTYNFKYLPILVALRKLVSYTYIDLSLDKLNTLDFKPRADGAEPFKKIKEILKTSLPDRNFVRHQLSIPFIQFIKYETRREKNK